MRQGLTAVGLVALAVLGCRHAAITRLADAPAKPGNCQLQLFAAEAEVGRPFQAVCLIDTGLTTSGMWPRTDSTVPTVPQTAATQACECGGDALIVPRADATGGTTVKVIRFTGQ